MGTVQPIQRDPPGPQQQKQGRQHQQPEQPPEGSAPVLPAVRCSFHSRSHPFLQNQKRFHPLIRDESAFFCKKWGRPTKICAATPSQFNILPFYVIYKNVFSAVPYGTCSCAYVPADNRQPAGHRLHAPEHLPSSWWYRSGSACRSPGGHPVPAGSRGSPGRAWS